MSPYISKVPVASALFDVLARRRNLFLDLPKAVTMATSPGEDTIASPPLSRASMNGQVHDPPSGESTAERERKDQRDPGEHPVSRTIDLDDAINILSSELAREDPNSYNDPTAPLPPFRESNRVPAGTHFLPPRHASDGPSSEFLQAELERDMTPRNLLRLLLVNKVPVERLQVPFSDENTVPEDLCVAYYCPINGERKSRVTSFLLSPNSSTSLCHLLRPWITENAFNNRGIIGQASTNLGSFQIEKEDMSMKANAVHMRSGIFWKIVVVEESGVKATLLRLYGKH